MKDHKYNYQIDDHGEGFCLEFFPIIESKGIRYQANGDKKTGKWEIFTVRVKNPMVKVIKTVDTFEEVCDFMDSLEDVHPYRFGFNCHNAEIEERLARKDLAGKVYKFSENK